MIQITQWLDDWSIAVSPQALLDLKRRMGRLPCPAPPMAGRSEAAVNAQLQLVASRPPHNGLLLRNNSGAWTDPESGRVTRYGLGNISPQFNEQFASPDFVGGRPLLITPAHVGQTVCQLWLVEGKEGDWRPGKDRKRETRQQRFGDLFVAMGAQFQFYNGGDLL